MFIRVFACSLPCLSVNELAPWPACLSEYLLAAYTAYQIISLHRGLHVYQSLCLQLGLLVRINYTYMLADVPAFQILYQQLRLLIKFCACIGPVYTILSLQLGLLIRFCASS
jgi:hypothetical protein